MIEKWIIVLLKCLVIIIKIATNEPPTIHLTNVKKVIKEALY